MFLVTICVARCRTLTAQFPRVSRIGQNLQPLTSNVTFPYKRKLSNVVKNQQQANKKSVTYQKPIYIGLILSCIILLYILLRGHNSMTSLVA